MAWKPTRLLAGLLLVVATGAAAIAGAADVALRTTAGRAVVVRAALDAINKGIDGKITIGSVEGTLRHGLNARDVLVVGEDGAVLARIPALNVQYRIRDLLQGRIVLGTLRMERPEIELVQAPGGRLNAENVLRLGLPAKGPPSPRPLVAFADVEIVDATLRIRTLVDSSATVPEREDGAHGPMRVRRIEGLNARLPYFRLLSPIPGERAIRFDIAELSARMSDPALDIRDAQGTVIIDGDSAMLDLPAARLPNTRLSVKGTISWRARSLGYGLALETKNGRLDDVRGLAPKLPEGLAVSGPFTIHQDGPVLYVQSEDIAVRGINEGGSFAGKLRLSLGPGQQWGMRNTDLVLDNFDLEYMRPILDTMPIAGRLSGALKADGPREEMAIDVDWSFRDSLVAGRPESQVRAHGVVSMGQRGGFAFRGLAVDSARIELATVRRLIPAVELKGIIVASGTLNGRWLEPEFGGTLRYRDAPLPVSVARGVVRLDARGDTIGVWANLAWDSLRFEGFRSSYPEFTLSGSFGGETRVSGYADSLVLDADIAGPAGRLVGGGALTMVGPRFAARVLDVGLRAVSLDGLHPRLPPSRLFGRVAGAVELDSGAAPVARLTAALDSSEVAGSRVDSLRGVLGIADSVVRFDQFAAWGPGIRLSALGGLGWGVQRADSLLVAGAADALLGAEPFVRWLVGLQPDTAGGGPSGAAEIHGTIKGRLDSIKFEGGATTPRLHWGDLRTARARLRAEWGSASKGEIAIHWIADSVTYAGYSVNALNLAFSGRLDSLGWLVDAQVSDSARVVGYGRAHRDTLALALSVDSLRLRMPERAWRADTGALVVVTDDWLSFERMTLTSEDGGGRLAIAGTLPLSGSGHLHVTAEQLPVKDLMAAVQRDYVTVGGAISGTFDLTGTAAQPVMLGAFSVSNGVFGDFRVPQMEGSLNYEARRLKGLLALRRLGEHILDLELDLPIDLALATVAERRVEAPLTIRGVADSVDLAFLSALTPQVRQASGQFDADIGITGTWDHPVLSGAFDVIDAAFSLPSVGARYERLTARFGLVGDTVRIDTLSLQSQALASRSRERGTASIGGFLRLERLSRPVVQLRLAANEFHLMDVRNFLAATVTGNLQLTGPLVGATLTGTGTMTRGVLYFADLVTKQVVNLQDTLLRDVGADTSLIRRQGLGPAFHNVFWDSLGIVDLGVEMGSDVWLRSSEANIQLEGGIVLGKEGPTYNLDGTLTARRGTYDLVASQLLDRRFDVTRGQVKYFGTPDLNADLDIDATYLVRRRSEESVTVGVHIGGTLYVPKLTLSSDVQPPLSNADIVSLLMFGTTRVEQLASGEGRQQMVMDQLGGVLTGLGQTALGSIASNLGLPINYVQLRPGEGSPEGLATGTQVELGWQLTQDFLVTLSPRVCKTGTFNKENFGASLEYRLSRDWRVSASMDPAGTCGATGARTANTGRQMGFDLFWEKKF